MCSKQTVHFLVDMGIKIHCISCQTGNDMLVRKPVYIFHVVVFLITIFVISLLVPSMVLSVWNP